MHLNEIKAEDSLKGIEDHPDEDPCEACYVSENAYKKLPKAIVCPECGHNETEVYIDDEDFVAVQKDNGCQPQKVRMMPVINCEKCCKHIGLLAIPVTYNANHDIYYTGEGSYIPTDISKVHEKHSNEIKKSINQFLERREKGEDNLAATYPALWLSYCMDHYMADMMKALNVVIPNIEGIKE
jgi:hypothetical protein